ncbi:MAG TPA: ATP-binding protein [Hydrogenophaga sp.]|uniref:ATP-binding protein n=1 Tax=Hydrogenophaga sp. TaxID=1904254 RepID=UPI002C0C17EF|nr:ATP-binding protein [Hydrogenophaga sp.]HMN92298.1 ATP-binding protein [Hydrogenophaga sp.]HMP09333.1 ATP-binding protein [Hydrogenophaga sp.]
MALTVCLLGGESTGKSTLAEALHRHLTERHGMAVSLVPEHLRDWCSRQGRAPHAHEQAALADEQARLIGLAQGRDGIELVLADTSALMVATYSELYFNDTSLHARALELQRQYDLTLLMGLDLPWVADGLFRDSPSVREATDRVLRRELQRGGIAFQAIYGQGADRLHAALRIIGHRLGKALAPETSARPIRAANWSCERCSDPDCEHRLFSRLLVPGTRS